MPRMNILSTSEKDEFDTPPILNSRQRKQFFDMPENYQDDIQKLRSPTTKIASVLAYGYFGGQTVFLYRTISSADIAYVCRRLGFDERAFDIGSAAEHGVIIKKSF